MSGFLEAGPQRQISIVDYELPKGSIIPITFFPDAVVPISLNGQQWNALMDTGSAINCISSTTLTKSRIHHHNLRSNNKTFTTANNKQMSPTGCLQLHVKVQGKTYSDKFYVFPNLSQSIILGRPFLHRYWAKINFEKQELKLTKGVNINSVHKHVIKPGKSILIKGTLTQQGIPNGLHGCIGQHTRRNGLLIHDSMVTSCGNTVPIKISNTTSLPITLKRGQKVAAFKPLSANEQTRISPGQEFGTTQTLDNHVNSIINQTSENINRRMPTDQQIPGIDTSQRLWFGVFTWSVE